MTKADVSLYSWNRFITRNFVILPELLGKVLRFTFENHTIKVILPGINHVDRGNEFDPIISVGARRTSDNKPLEFHVNKVDVEVIKPIRIKVPSEALNRNANAYDLFSQKEQEGLNRIADSYKVIAEKSFEYWMRILRWKCDDSRIGSPEIHDYNSGWSTYLYDLDAIKKIWIEPVVFYVRGNRKVGIQQWSEIEDAVQRNLEPPTYVEFKHSAEQNIKIGDLNRAIVDLAISCETYLRSAVLDSLPSGLEPSIVNYVESANINQFISKFFPNILDEDQKKIYQKIKSGLSRLFAHRNKIMHKGITDRLTYDTCQKHLQTTSQLIAIQS